MRRLPLNALRVFEAVGRLRSAARAADELGVTPGAVSKQLKHLEDQLQLTLLARSGTGLILTQSGAELHDRISISLTSLLYAVEDVQSEKVEGKLRIDCMPAFASQWLIPRLRKFTDRFPKVSIQIVPSHPPHTGLDQSADLAILFGRPNWPDASITTLKEIEFFPVCAPSILNTRRLRTADLAQFRLFDGLDVSHWHEWFAARGVPLPRSVESIEFGDFNHNLSAARAGLGFAMGDNITAAEDLKTGALVRPFDTSLKSPGIGYFILTPEHRQISEQALAFRNWILREAAGSD
ncbi:Glycine cleavage system transcriptional activator [Roseovarius albus]|uniref:Glycine cleavage system transcriptional activator n=1 Tax=Roseovarius albus TaxID=1247867 RepID=A0A1X6ZJL0_9RHOB|nr:LysR substrate-binding domain-containing protein [Roseovarius albus]SLN53471.1 Glycine cleavage system transcriptional activator [Roseovarius albus]